MNVVLDTLKYIKSVKKPYLASLYFKTLMQAWITPSRMQDGKPVCRCFACGIVSPITLCALISPLLSSTLYNLISQGPFCRDWGLLMTARMSERHLYPYIFCQLWSCTPRIMHVDSSMFRTRSVPAPQCPLSPLHSFAIMYSRKEA